MNIDNMPAGQELDRLVAEKVMGWTLTDRQPSQDTAYYTNGRVVCPLMVEAQWPDGRRERSDFKPSTEIAHAFEIMKRVTSSGGMSSLETMGSELWMARVQYNWNYMSGWTLNARTAPLALCRAALIALNP